MKYVVKVYSYVYKCASCNTFYSRLPVWDGLDKGDQCDKCGCTSFSVTQGRPYGPKSRQWPDLML
jgi:rRNA maturation endonuclease Nob1